MKPRKEKKTMNRLFLLRIAKASKRNSEGSAVYLIRMATLTLVLAAFLIAGVASVAFSQESDEKWDFKITPYFWFFNVEGTLRYSPRIGGSPQVKFDNKDLLESLDFGFMLSGEARKGRWSIFTDVMYLDLSNEKGRVKAVDLNLGGPINLTSTNLDLGTDSSLETWIWTLAGGYEIVKGPTLSLNLHGGFRFLTADASTDWRLTATVSGPGAGQVFQRSGSISQSKDIWDAIAGFRGEVRLWGSNWYIPYYFDIGTGNSDLTWQGMMGLSYRIGWGEIKFVYRYLYYDTDDGLFEEVSFEGPALGLTIHF
jgi:hypothetical protein